MMNKAVQKSIPNYVYVFTEVESDNSSIWSCDGEFERSFRSTGDIQSVSSEMNVANTGWSRWGDSESTAVGQRLGKRQGAGSAADCTIFDRRLQDVNTSIRPVVASSDEKLKSTRNQSQSPPRNRHALTHGPPMLSRSLNKKLQDASKLPRRKDSIIPSGPTLDKGSSHSA
jgi:hypothetical protein